MISSATPNPAVLAENQFMYNPADCAFLLSPEGYQAISDHHVDGITTFISQKHVKPA